MKKQKGWYVREFSFEMRTLPTREGFTMLGVHGHFLGRLIQLLVSVAHICKLSPAV